jgi:hypothetical protein
MRKLYVGLLHFPVYNKNNLIITSAVTNFDIHDISRASKTFGAENYFIITPNKGQHKVVSQIISHWQEGFGSTYNPDRKDALDSTFLIDSIDDAIKFIFQKEGVFPLVVATSANKDEKYNHFTVNELRKVLQSDGEPIFLVFGTGYGMVLEELPQIKYMLEPIYGVGDYNHLSVRSAVSIYLHSLKAPSA